MVHPSPWAVLFNVEWSLSWMCPSAVPPMPLSPCLMTSAPLGLSWGLSNQARWHHPRPPLLDQACQPGSLPVRQILRTVHLAMFRKQSIGPSATPRVCVSGTELETLVRGRASNPRHIPAQPLSRYRDAFRADFSSRCRRALFASIGSVPGSYCIFIFGLPCHPSVVPAGTSQ
jgi:hypothetical protein